jgi:phosphatidylserine decarboxylase
LIKVWDPKTQELFHEKVLGSSWINKAYGNPIGRLVASSTIFQRLLSRCVGAFQKSPFSKYQISSFTNDFGVDLSLFEAAPQGYSSFNDFFIRKVKNPDKYFSGYLSVSKTAELRSPAEARLSVFSFEPPSYSGLLSIKGHKVQLTELLADNSKELFKAWDPSPETRIHAWVFRLCPVDYHRFHFFDSGRTQLPTTRAGHLHSVNPAALNVFPRIFLENERQECLLQTDNFGPVYFAEIGALCVGLIHQTFEPEKPFKAGDEKGYFDFGGSTVILVTSDRYVLPNPQILEKTSEGFETKVFLGDLIGNATNK